MKTKLFLFAMGLLLCGLTAQSQTLRIEDTDAGTIYYDGSLKSYSAADNGTAINLTNTANQQIIWSYNASSSGTYQLTWRYTRKASMSSVAAIYVNGSLVQEISFPETASSAFTTYSINASLNSGTNQIILKTIEDAEFADIDWIEITGNGSSGTTTITIQENETGFCSVDGTVDNNHTGYTGSGFANTDNALGNGIDYKVVVGTAGTYTIEIRYSATSDRPANLIQDGSVVASNISMPLTADWDTWNTVSTSAYLNAGASDLRLEATGSSGLPNIDYITISGSSISVGDCNSTTPVTYTLSTNVNGSGSVNPSSGTYNEGTVVTLTATPASGWQFDSWSGDASGTGTTTTVTMNSNLSVTANFSEIPTGGSEITIQENETGFCAVDGAVESEHSGYTGSGYANTDNASGYGIDYAVNAGSSGTYTIEIRYAATSDRPANLIQNGSVVASNINLPSTGAWTTWNAITTTAYLSAGESSLRLEATSSDGLPNVDYLYISGSDISVADCGSSGGNTYSLSTNVSPSGSGYISLSPSGGIYDEGTVVTITAIANTDYEFSSWSGDASGSSSTTTVTMNSDLSVTANFSYTGGGSGNVDFSLIGYATQNGGTTGGSGGTTVYASTGDEILGYISEKKDGVYASGLIIIVNGTITPSNTSATKIDIKDCRDVSLIGAGSGAEFNGIGVKVYKAGNVILRNLNIHHVDIGDKDCIGIEGPADHIWVDHCELHNEYGDNVDKDYYDGLLDAKAESEYITYSWNYFHDSWKTMLVGSSDSDDHDRKITGHHNIYEHCNSRMPLYRFGTGHFFNNYYVDGASTAINSRMGACLRIENNYFENTLNPYVSAYSSEDGYGDLINNILVNSPFEYSSDVRELQSCSSGVPYSYTDVLNSASEVPGITRQYSGVGKLSDPTSYTVKSADDVSVTAMSNDLNLLIYPNPFNNTTTVYFNLNVDQKLTFKLFDMTGRLVDVMEEKACTSGINSFDYSNPELNAGVYILSVQNGNTVETKRLIIE